MLRGNSARQFCEPAQWNDIERADLCATPTNYKLNMYNKPPAEPNKTRPADDISQSNETNQTKPN